MTEAMTLTVLGASGSYPGAGGACSGYLVQAGTTSIWLDAGSGTLANLQRHIGLEELSAVVISHEHVDHWTDLEHLAVACKWIIGRNGLPVFAQDSLRTLMRVGDAAEVFDWHPTLPGGKALIGGIGLLFSKTEHPVPTLACRIDYGAASLGYSADTGPGWGFEELGGGLDVALCEATYLSDREGELPHLSARQAGELARRAGVGRLIITHLWAGVDRMAAKAEAESAFGREVAVAAVGERYEI
jgi:ribonuclease BN (tRNA processing enzyme)